MPPFHNFPEKFSKKRAAGALLCEVAMQGRFEKRLLAAVIVGAVLAAVGLIAAADPALAEPPTQQQIDWCINADHKSSADQQIAGCTAAIQSGKWSGKGLAWAFNDRGFAYLLSENGLDHALADFTEAIRLDPNDAVAYANRGIIYQRNGDLDQAIAEYDEAIRLDPTYVFGFQNRGNAYRREGEFDRAIADFSEAIRLDPTFTVALKSRGSAYLAKGDIDKAIADYDQIIQLDPKNEDTFNNRCAAYELKGDPDRALTNCDEAIRLNPQDPAAFNTRGSSYRLKGDFGRAIADFSEAIRLDPDAPTPYFNRGVTYLHSGAPAQAAADFDRLIQLSPANPYAALWLDIAADRGNLPSQYTQAISRLDMTRWPAPILRLYLGQLTPEDVLAAADDADAKTKQRQLCESDFFIGQLTLRRHDKDKAVRLFQQVAAGCRNEVLLSADATAELKRLGVTP
jgi:tetratricopeptide (TPR) repeat protein